MGFLKNLFGGSPRTITTEPAGLKFVVQPGQSVLEAALGQGIAFPHSCTVGTCGSCKCKLVSGKIREIANFAYVLSAEELQGGIILACQAAPRSDLILEVAGLSDRHLTPPGDFTGTVIETVDLTHDIKRVAIALDRPLAFDAGQYAHLSAEGVWGARAYSFANPPRSGGCETLTFFIRHVPGGLFTDLVFSGGLTGKTLKVHGPLGNFWLRESRAPLIAIAGGSGLAPLVSMLQDAAAGNVGRPCLVLFGARAQADLYAHEEFAALGQQWNGAFKFVPVLSDEPVNTGWAGERGLVTARIAAHAKDYAGSDAEAYLCGPPPMIDAALPLLRELGLRDDNLHFDKFLDGSHGLHRQE